MRFISSLVICLLCMPFVQLLYGQEVYQGIVCIKQNQAQVRHDTLYIEMDISIQGLKVNDRESLSLYPTLFKGSDSLELAPIILNGKKMQQKADRAIKLQGRFEPQNSAYLALKNDPLTHKIIVYRDTLSFTPWMKEAGLKLTGHVKNQDGTIIQTSTNILTDKINFFE